MKINKITSSLRAAVVTLASLLLLGSSAPASADYQNSATFAFLDAEGNPLRIGQVHWETKDKTLGSVTPLRADNKGLVTVTDLPSGTGTVWLTRSYLPQGVAVNARWENVSFSSDSTVYLRLPETPKRNLYKVRVTDPQGDAVPGALVQLTGYSSGEFVCAGDVVAGFSATDWDGHQKLTSCGRWHPGFGGYTDSNGEFQSVGFALETPVTATAEFRDLVMKQRTTPITLTPGVTGDLVLRESQKLSITAKTIKTTTKRTAEFTVLATEPGKAPYGYSDYARKGVAGISIRINNSTGQLLRRCGGETAKLTAKTDSAGKATFNVCVSQTDNFWVVGPGNLRSQTVQVLALDGPPTEPRNLKVSTLNGGSIKLTWAKPAFAGGRELQGYEVTVVDNETLKKRVIFYKKPNQLFALINKLSPVSSYAIQVRAKSAAGLSKPSGWLSLVVVKP